MNEDGTVTWTTLYERYKVEINNDPNDALGESVDKEEDEITDEKDDLEVPEDDYEEEWHEEKRPKKRRAPRQRAAAVARPRYG